MQNFKDKVVLVTGGNSGICRSAALRLAERGARVAIAARRRQELEGVVEEIHAAGGEAIGISTDIADLQQIDDMVEAVISSFGRLDAAFNNVGVMGKWDAIDACTIADFDHAIGINLRGTWLCARAEIIQIKKHGGGGAIVNTSSWLSKGAIRGSALYSMTKAGLDAMTRALTFECADYGIRINNVAPGVVDTPMTSSGTNAETLAGLIAQTPLKRLTTPEEIAEAAIWRCSEAASGVTGQTLLIDGGYAIPGNRF